MSVAKSERESQVSIDPAYAKQIASQFDKLYATLFAPKLLAIEPAKPSENSPKETKKQVTKVNSATKPTSKSPKGKKQKIETKEEQNTEHIPTIIKPAVEYIQSPPAVSFRKSIGRLGRQKPTGNAIDILKIYKAYKASKNKPQGVHLSCVPQPLYLKRNMRERNPQSRVVARPQPDREHPPVQTRDSPMIAIHASLSAEESFSVLESNRNTGESVSKRAFQIWSENLLSRCEQPDGY